MAPRTGLVKQASTTAVDVGDMSLPAKVRCKDDTVISVLRRPCEREAHQDGHDKPGDCEGPPRPELLTWSPDPKRQRSPQA